MTTLTTATGKVFRISWVGQSTIDYALRFCVTDSDVDTVHETFKSPEETARLTRSFDGVQKSYEGFTVYLGFRVADDRSIIVTLAQEGLT